MLEQKNRNEAPNRRKSKRRFSEHSDYKIMNLLFFQSFLFLSHFFSLVAAVARLLSENGWAS